MTKMAATPIYGKNPSKNLLLRNHETWYVASGTPFIIVCLNDDPRATLTYLTTRSNLVTWAFLLEPLKTVDFSELIAGSYLKVCRDSHLIDYMKECEY